MPAPAEEAVLQTVNVREPAGGVLVRRYQPYSEQTESGFSADRRALVLPCTPKVISTPPVTREPQLNEPGTPLRKITFVVLDLETTGGSHSTDAVTEVGAVKIRGGQLLGELATLVNPGTEIPPQAVALTGITQAMVSNAPRMESVLPGMLEFLSGAVLVAHNAPFDAGFLRSACRRHGRSWPRPPVLCTARLARRILTKDEAPSVRLSALARLLHARTAPNHRALVDARVTVDVLHGLLRRAGDLGAHTLAELLDLTRGVTPEQQRKRHLAADLPHAPGVYLFRGPRDQVLYVGTSGDLRRRVQSYFTAGERRSRIQEMIGIAEWVDVVHCAHTLQAQVRELRLIAAYRPPYNRRSRDPDRVWWVTLTDEAFPRLSLHRTARDGALGPFPSRAAASSAIEALQDAVPIRRCTQRISARRPGRTACMLAEIGRCGAPCIGAQTVAEYAAEVAAIRSLMDGRDDRLLRVLAAGIDRLAAAERFESAAAARDRMVGLIGATARTQRLGSLAALAELVAARGDGSGGWELAVLRYGRLAAAGVAHRGVPLMPVVDLLLAAAETVSPGPGPLYGAPAAEVQVLLGWLSGPDVQLVRAVMPWAEPARGAGPWTGWVERASAGRAGYPRRRPV